MSRSEISALDRIQLTVKLEMPERFDEIKTLTDEAIAELERVY
jgi:hypothetical protein